MNRTTQIVTVAGLALICTGCNTMETASDASGVAVDARGRILSVQDIPVQAIPREANGQTISANVTTFGIMACDADPGETGAARSFNVLLRTAQLIQELRSTIGDRVYFVPQTTLAVDYLVRISTHAGKVPTRKTVIEGADGELIRYRTTRGEVGEADIVPIGYQQGAMGKILASRIAQAASQVPLSQAQVQAKRLAGYLEESGAVKMTEKIGLLVDTAAQMEREKLLKIYTDHLITFVEQNRETYQKYIQEKDRLERARAEQERREKSAAALAFGNALLGGLAAGSGDSAAAAQAQRNMVTLAAEMNAASERVTELGEALTNLTGAFANAVQPTEVSFLDEVVKLAGTHEEQIASARALIKRKLRQELNRL